MQEKQQKHTCTICVMTSARPLHSNRTVSPTYHCICLSHQHETISTIVQTMNKPIEQMRPTTPLVEVFAETIDSLVLAECRRHNAFVLRPPTTTSTDETMSLRRHQRCSTKKKKKQITVAQHSDNSDLTNITRSKRMPTTKVDSGLKHETQRIELPPESCISSLLLVHSTTNKMEVNKGAQTRQNQYYHLDSFE
jgi:hypothetical protein